MNKIFTHAAELITNDGVYAKKGIAITHEDLGIVCDGALVRDEKGAILWLGPTSALPKKYLKNSKRVNLSGKILTPALVDCHTHLVFAGSRHNELAMRLTGKSYQDIAAAGGGIVSSTSATRQATEQQLYDLGVERIKVAMDLGIGILEIKSGYGLDWPTERKILRVARKLQKTFSKKIIIRITFLGAHAFPTEAKTAEDREIYVRSILEEMLPAVVREKLADACDVFFDQGYFDASQSRRILTRAQQLGLDIKLHADELADVNAAKLAAELKALSADHLLMANEEGLKKMAKAGVVAVILPTTALYLKMPYAPIDKMRKAGLCLALSTDFNPGSSPTQHLPFVMSLACLQMGFTMAEAFAATTYGGARALGLQETQGHLAIGQKPKIAVFNCPSYQSLIGQVAHPGLCNALL